VKLRKPCLTRLTFLTSRSTALVGRLSSHRWHARQGSRPSRWSTKPRAAQPARCEQAWTAPPPRGPLPIGRSAAGGAGQLLAPPSRSDLASWIPAANPARSFIERIAIEQLRYDHRAARYSTLGEVGFAEQDDIFMLLDIMASQVQARAALQLVLGGPKEDPVDHKPGTKWTLEQRQQVRAFNLLERWARALSDPRLLWLNPLSPLRNYAALLVALTECAEHECLAEWRLARLVSTTLAAFAQTERRQATSLASATTNAPAHSHSYRRTPAHWPRRSSTAAYAPASPGESGSSTGRRSSFPPLSTVCSWATNAPQRRSGG
jgi:hypothetical protein